MKTFFNALPNVLALAGLWMLLTAAGALEPLERLTLEARYLTRPAPGFHAPITIVAIDERALQRYGQIPWGRQLIARLVDRLADSKVSAVGIDIAFNEPSRDPQDDQALAASLHKIPTVLPTFLAFSDAGRRTLRPIDPLPGLREAATGIGSVQLAVEPQTEIWQIDPYQDTEDRRVPAFPIALLSAAKGPTWTLPRPGFPWRSAPLFIDYRGPANSAPQMSVVDVLESKGPIAGLAGHMVLLGAVAAGLPDTNFAVPDNRGGPMSGVELSAHVIDDLEGNGFQRRLNPFAIACLLALLALVPGSFLAKGTTPSAQRAGALAAGLGTWLLLALAAFRYSIWLEVVPVLGFLVTCYLFGLFAERTQLLQSRNQLLARYASDLATEAHRQRSRIEGELHDGIQQLLVVMRREVRQLLKQPTPEAAARLAFLDELTDQADIEIKRLRADLLPAALRFGGLVEALQSLAREFGSRGALDMRVEVDGWDRLSDELESELYWLVKEALNNAEKHAGPVTVRVKLERRRDEVRLEVIDDGKGFNPPDLGIAPTGLEHSGLHRMWLRMKGNRGDLQVISSPGRGTQVRFSLPIEARRSGT